MRISKKTGFIARTLPSAAEWSAKSLSTRSRTVLFHRAFSQSEVFDFGAVIVGVNSVRRVRQSGKRDPARFEQRKGRLQPAESRVESICAAIA